LGGPGENPKIVEKEKIQPQHQREIEVIGRKKHDRIGIKKEDGS